MSRRRKPTGEFPGDGDVDLNPLIDVITMLIIFFILGGKFSQDVRVESITVPPTKTATKIEPETGWSRIVINVFGNTQVKKGSALMKIRIETKEWESKGIDDYTAYQKLRELLDKSYDRAEKFPDPKGTGMMLPKIVLEIRADADTQYRVVQEVQQIVTDSIDPFKNMMPKVHAGGAASARPFVNINFTSRIPGD